MKLLLVGSGAREHALAWKLSRESSVEELVCAPGNAGIAQAGSKSAGPLAVRCAAVDVADPQAVLALAVREGVDFTVVGPELPLAHGVADRFLEAGRPLFGPVQAAARLESSKAFAKEFMARHGIPTARFTICQTERDALDACDAFGFPVVVKADGLAAGKGVTVAPDRA
nr:ATP-grasp domain-containing protein [Desulfuromonadales bacterium]